MDCGVCVCVVLCFSVTQAGEALASRMCGYREAPSVAGLTRHAWSALGSADPVSVEAGAGKRFANLPRSCRSRWCLERRSVKVCIEAARFRTDSCLSSGGEGVCPCVGIAELTGNATTVSFQASSASAGWLRSKPAPLHPYLVVAYRKRGCGRCPE